MNLNYYEMAITIMISLVLNYGLITLSLKRHDRAVKKVMKAMKKISLKDIKSRKLLQEANEKIEGELGVRVLWLVDSIKEMFKSKED